MKLRFGPCCVVESIVPSTPQAARSPVNCNNFESVNVVPMRARRQGDPPDGRWNCVAPCVDTPCRALFRPARRPLELTGPHVPAGSLDGLPASVDESLLRGLTSGTCNWPNRSQIPWKWPNKWWQAPGE